MTGARARSAKLPPYTTLRDLPGVGQSIADDYSRIGITSPEQLLESDPEEMFDRLELLDGPTDRCVLYVFRCARYAVSTSVPDPSLLDWWAWKIERDGSASTVS